MATGKIHHIATVGLAAATAIVAAGSGASLTQAAFLGSGCLVGVLITPDLDMHHDVHSHQVVRKTLGMPLAFLWRGLWWLYARLIPYHRHPLSHWPVLGTVGRLAYLASIALLVTFFLNIPLPEVQKITWLPWVAGGLPMADILHWVMDIA